MQKFVPLNKQSKKAQRAHHARRRSSWHGLHPVTRVVPSGKLYRRQKTPRTGEEPPP